MSYKSSLTGAELDAAGTRIKLWTEKGLATVFNKMAARKTDDTSELEIGALFNMMLNTKMRTTYPNLLEDAKRSIPYYVQGMAFVCGAGWANTTGLFMPNVTLSVSSTGDQLKLFNRLCIGLPSALIIPVKFNINLDSVVAAPFYLVSFNGVNEAVYRSVSNFSRGTFPEIKITFNFTTDLKTITSIALAHSEYSPVTLEFAPIKNPLFSISDQGTLNTSRTVVSASSTGDALRVYEALAAGYPPAMGVNMTCSDGKVSIVWLYPARTSTAIIYESSSLTGSPASGKKLRISISRSSTGSYTMLAALITDSTT